MTVQEYLQELDETISASPEVIHVEVIRRTVWETGTEVVGLYRYKLNMSDGSLLELMERLVQEQQALTVSKYRHHWQDKDARIIKRWDNAPHHKQIKTFPHHLHEGSETNVVNHNVITGLQIVNLVSSILANQA